MRRFAAVLAILGLPWAFLASHLVVVGFVGLLWAPKGHFQINSGSFYFPSFLALSLLGFYIWIGWIWIAATGKYILRPWIFWSLSALDHIGWLAPLCWHYFGSQEPFLSVPLLSIYMVSWLIVNFGLGVILSVATYLEQSTVNC
jgi:hypothetical protein